MTQPVFDGDFARLARELSYAARVLDEIDTTRLLPQDIEAIQELEYQASRVARRARALLGEDPESGTEKQSGKETT